MLPVVDVLTNEFTTPVYYGNTFKIDGRDYDRLNGNIDELESVRQAVYLILSTERYAHPIYSWDYGIELMDLIGKPMTYVISELPRRVEDALTQDNRITSVQNFEFDRKGKRLHCSFEVVTDLGNLPTEVEVEV